MPGNEISFETKKVFEELKKAYERTDLGFNGEGTDFSPEFGLDITLLVDFLKATQPEDYKAIIEESSLDFMLREISRELDENGTIKCLLDGLYVKTPQGPKRKLFIYYTKPNNSINPGEFELYKKNRFFVTRQIPYKNYETDTIDLGIGVNGIFLFAVELKNGTSQTYIDAIGQLKRRDYNTPFFKHILCSFAMDRFDIYMSADLCGEHTKFLPFNRGTEDGGAGNPRDSLYPTDYFYKDIMTPENITYLIQYFIFNDGEKMIFPRYHQYKCTNKIITDVLDQIKNDYLPNYLIYASTGSGKSNMISWTAYRLAYLHDERNLPVFDMVIIVSNRLSISRNLTNTISSMPHEENFFSTPKTSSKLVKAINDCESRIVLTNLQKFPFVVQGVHSTAGKRYAVLIDEGHDSTTGIYVDNAKASLNSGDSKSIKEIIGEEGFDFDKIADMIKERKQSAEGDVHNVTFMAFTGTPKPETKMAFGIPIPQPDGKVLYDCFYKYTMKQAIEEHFVLDPLSNYTEFKTYCTAKCISDNDAVVQAAAATRALNIAKMLDEKVIFEKSGAALDFFDAKVGELKGNSKMMIVCTRREQVYLYYKCLSMILDAQQRDWKVLVAYSGSLHIDGIDKYENDINQLPEGKTIEEVFKKNKNYKILVVADKFTTGFDEPFLTTMVVDDALSGVKAVQTLSRLNRPVEGFDKKIAVLDFVNTFDEMIDAFSPFYADAKYYRTQSDDDLDKLAKFVKDLNLVSDNDVKIAARCLLVAKVSPSDDEWAKVSIIVRKAIDRIDEMARDYAPDDEFKQIEQRKAIIWTIRRFVRFYNLQTQLRSIHSDEYLYMHVFYSYLLLCLKGGRIPSSLDISKVVKFLNISIEDKGTFSNPEYDDQIEIVGSAGAKRKKPSEIILKTLEEVVVEFNAAMGLPEENNLFYSVKAFLETNQFVKKALLQFDEFDDFKRKIVENATNAHCNVYNVIVNNDAYRTLIANPNFDWKSDLLYPVLVIIWHENKNDEIL